MIDWWTCADWGQRSPALLEQFTRRILPHIVLHENPGERFSIILALPVRSTPPAPSQIHFNTSQTQRPTTKSISQRAVVPSNINELLEPSAPYSFRCQLCDQSLNFNHDTHCGRRNNHWYKISSLERRRVDDRMEHRSKIVQLSAPRSGPGDLDWQVIDLSVHQDIVQGNNWATFSLRSSIPQGPDRCTFSRFQQEVAWLISFVRSQHPSPIESRFLERARLTG